MSIFFRDGDKVEETYKGAVLTTRERNYRDDSDFYATVFDVKTGQLANIEYDTTRFAGGGSATVDATPEVVAAANDAAYKFLRETVFGKYLNDIAVPVVGDRVRVKKGRKVPVGTEGKLFWIGPERTFGGYSEWSQTKSQKVGVALDDEKDDSGRYKNVVWTYMANLEVANLGDKFKYSEAKRVMKGLKRSGWNAWLAYMAYPLAFVR